MKTDENFAGLMFKGLSNSQHLNYIKENLGLGTYWRVTEKNGFRINISNDFLVLAGTNDPFIIYHTPFYSFIFIFSFMR